VVTTIIVGKKYALIDDEDVSKVNQYVWHLHHNGEKEYAATTITEKDVLGRHSRYNLLMHRLIMDVEKGEYVYLNDGNGLNCTRKNLHKGTRNEGEYNVPHKKSKYKGVSWDNALEKWIGHIRCNGRIIFLGSSDIEEECHEAYQWALNEIHNSRTVYPRNRESQYEGIYWFPQIAKFCGIGPELILVCDEDEDKLHEWIR
jgi:hypothetical protein